MIRNEIRVAATGLRAMALAAHPDDEDGATLAYLRSVGVETHICFTTRGEGGQNESGPALGLELAAIRTREIEEACKILGAKAWHLNRADFGFSKSVEETLQVWNHDETLERLVRVIRKIRPHIVITNHNPDGTDHGHHRASGKLLVEAFDAAADEKKFPEQKLEAWKIARVYLRHFAPTAETFSVDVSKRDELSGLSPTEIGALALSRHESQGMMPSVKSGERVLRYFSVLKTREVNGVKPAHMTQSIIGEPVEHSLIELVYSPFGVYVDEYASAMAKLGDKLSLHSRKHLSIALVEGLGLKMEASSADAVLTAGGKTMVTLRVVNTGARSITLNRISFQTNSPKWKIEDKKLDKELKPGAVENVEVALSAEDGTPIDFPADEVLMTQETQTAAVIARAEFTFEKATFSIEAPVPVQCARPYSFAPTPASILIFSESDVNKVTDEVVQIKMLGTVNAQLKEPAFVAAKAGPKPAAGEEGAIRVLNAKGSSAVWNLRNFVSVEQLEKGAVTVPLHAWDSKDFYAVPGVSVQRVSLEMPINMRVALVKGVDDQTYQALKLMQDAGVGRGTFSVELLSDEDLRAADLNRYQAILLDIRSTQQRPVVREAKERLREFMNNGGTVVCFYQKDFDWNEHGKGQSQRGAGYFRGTGGGGEIAPYPIELSFDRVTREDAEVRILNEVHPLLLKPCRIWPKDFAGWAQERGAYFPKTWSPEYTALLSCNDPGEKALDGGLLVADVGRGGFIYTSYFLHRQLRAQVPGAYRLLANMMSYSRMKR